MNNACDNVTMSDTLLTIIPKDFYKDRCVIGYGYESIAGLGEIEVYLVSKFQSCFIDDFGMSGSLLQYWKYVTQI